MREHVACKKRVQLCVHVRTQYSVDPGQPPPPPIVHILLANRFQIYLPFWLAVFLNFEDTFLGKKAMFVGNEKIRWTPKSTFASLVE